MPKMPPVIFTGTVFGLLQSFGLADASHRRLTGHTLCLKINFNNMHRSVTLLHCKSHVLHEINW